MEVSINEIEIPRNMKRNKEAKKILEFLSR